jgi:Flp pilus assembly protein TadD
MTPPNPKHLPTGQQVVAAVAKSLRLTTHTTYVTRMSDTTRKTFAQGSRVKPAIREEYVRGLAAALNARHLLFPLATERGTDRDEDVAVIARAIGEYGAAWDLCAIDTLSFSGALHPLMVLPLARLAFEDLGLRLACHARGRASWLLEAPQEEVVTSILDGKSFRKALQFFLRSYGLRRVDLIERLPVDTVEGWEQEGALPNDASISRVVAIFLERSNVPLGIDLDLRVAVALAELWSWLRRWEIPEVAVVRMAQGFVAWTRAMATWSERLHKTSDAVAWTALRGARDPAIALWWPGLSSTMPHPRLAADLRFLGGHWSPVCRFDNGALGDLALAAQDARASLRPDAKDLELADDELLAVLRCLPPPAHWGDYERLIAAPPSAEGAESRGTALLHEHRYAEAVQWLLVACERAAASAWPRIYLAQALEGLGDITGAEFAICEALRLDPSIADAHLVHASVLQARDRHVESLKALDGIAARSEQPAVVMQYEAQAYVGLRRWSEAEAACRAGLGYNQEHATLWSLLAASLDQQGRRREAIDAAKEAAHRGEIFMLDALTSNDRIAR